MAWFNFDVMIDDMYECTLEYEFINGTRIPQDKLREFVVDKKPLLRGKNFTIHYNGIYDKPQIKKRRQPLSIAKKPSFWKN